MSASIKYNPFQPNSIISPGVFVGRIDEIMSIERCLYQTRFGNQQHFLIQGERGIGKSSLLYYIEIMASGQIDSLVGGKFSFLSISVDLGSGLIPYNQKMTMTAMAMADMKTSAHLS